MKSFRIKDNGFTDDGYTFLFRSEQEMEKYLDHIRQGNDDRPFEHRWNYLVAEWVPYGPYGANKVVGWYQGILDGTTWNVVKLDKCPMDGVDPDPDAANNFTISG